ncbi:glycosyltransferase family 29 protein [Aurantiacibacter gangjinensis]|uniref:glycosyltransferase family 29 protein n=1 Tax=Aurantiacibacter gangjinensis TaxID=502682 RepID=UPI0006993553|nr:glycosyltransferase family 29 protein [Aurantiacibacter gangjinensis]APE27887.1 hypothetical protein BMF35_a1058 [Aurantiacibacter gangjinensis]
MAEENQNLYTSLHKVSDSFGRTSARLVPFIEPIIADRTPESLLDFGCGKGMLGKALREAGHDIELFDPYVPEFSNPPTRKLGLALCTDVMEHVPEEQVDDVLAQVRSYADDALFVISLTFADHILANGDNAHCTVRSAEWWQAKIEKVFGKACPVPTKQDTAAAFTTWSVADEALDKVRRLRRKERAKKRAQDLVLYPGKLLGSRLRNWVGVKEMRSRVAGKSVAIVGNASGLADKSHGSDIDRHDIVVRMNRGPILTAQSHGTKTDWLATSTYVSSGLPDGRDVSLILWMTPKTMQLPLWMLSPKRDIARYPKSMHKKLREKLGARPSTGMMIVDLVLNLGPYKLSLYGFDGFSTGSLSNIDPSQSHPHDFAAEARYLEKLASESDDVELFKATKVRT